MHIIAERKISTFAVLHSIFFFNFLISQKIVVNDAMENPRQISTLYNSQSKKHLELVFFWKKNDFEKERATAQPILIMRP